MMIQRRWEIFNNRLISVSLNPVFPALTHFIQLFVYSDRGVIVMQGGARQGSIATSQLQGLGFDPELRLG